MNRQTDLTSCSCKHIKLCVCFICLSFVSWVIIFEFIWLYNVDTVIIVQEQEFFCESLMHKRLQTVIYRLWNDLSVKLPPHHCPPWALILRFSLAQVPNVVVIVTDGRPQDRVAEVAAEAREKGIEIYAVGVARADMTSLRAMASPPFEDHVFLVESFDLIHQFGLQFQDKLCGKTGNDITVCKRESIFGIFIITFAKNTFQITTGSFLWWLAAGKRAPQLVVYSDSVWMMISSRVL